MTREGGRYIVPEEGGTPVKAEEAPEAPAIAPVTLDPDPEPAPEATRPAPRRKG